VSRLLALLLLCAAPLPAAAQTAGGEAGAGRVDIARTGQWIPFELTRDSLILFPVEIDGKPAKATLSTSGHTGIDRGYAETNGVAVTPQQPGSPGGATATPRSIRIGGYSQAGGSLAVRTLASPTGRAAVGDAFAMALGLDFLDDWTAELDFDQSRLRFLPRAGSASGTVPAQFGLQPPARVPSFSIQLGGTTIAGVVLDTSYAGSLSLSRSAWEPLDRTSIKATDILMGVGDRTEVRPYFHADGLKLAGHTIDDGPVDVFEAPAGGVNGRVGMALLARFNVALDLGRPGMRLTPRRTPAAPPRITMAGVQGALTDAGLPIRHVMRGSPAAAAGLKPGDTICTIDGERVQAAWTGTPKADWAQGPAGKRVRLGLCGGRQVELVLATFY
jgi:hypothetical protein